MLDTVLWVIKYTAQLPLFMGKIKPNMCVFFCFVFKNIFFSHLQRSLEKRIENESIRYKQVMKGKWFQSLRFWLWCENVFFQMNLNLFCSLQTILLCILKELAMAVHVCDMWQVTFDTPKYSPICRTFHFLKAQAHAWDLRFKGLAWLNNFFLYIEAGLGLGLEWKFESAPGSDSAQNKKNK